VPRTGHAIPFGGLLDGLTTLGPLARSVADLELALGVVAGPDGIDPFVVPAPLRPSSEVRLGDLRVAVHTDNGVRPADPEIAEAIRAAADRLGAAGCRVEEKRPPGIEETDDLFRCLLLADGGRFLRKILEGAGTDPASSSMRGLLDVPPVDGGELSDLVRRWDRFRSRLLGFVGGVDAILCPVSAIVACRHGEVDNDIAAFSYTMTWNLTGWPVAVVRVGTAPGGLPIGAQIVAAPWREDVALAVAAALETAFEGLPGPPI
jgi:amidase